MAFLFVTYFGELLMRIALRLCALLRDLPSPSLKLRLTSNSEFGRN
jgi:hypothetical protein